MKNPLWVFGYGSLVWRPAFAHVATQPGYIHGWARRFWQASTDHRGTEVAPGRVVTLVPEPSARCFGIAYRVDPAQVDAVLAQLDYREKGGYMRHLVQVTPVASASQSRPLDPNAQPVEALIYIATANNPNYVGFAPVAEIAGVVHRCSGPSGPNRDYVLNLERALAEHGAEDEHVSALAQQLRVLG